MVFIAYSSGLETSRKTIQKAYEWAEENGLTVVSVIFPVACWEKFLWTGTVIFIAKDSVGQVFKFNLDVGGAFKRTISDKPRLISKEL